MVRSAAALLAVVLTGCTPSGASTPSQPAPTEDAPGVVRSTVTPAQLGPGSTIVVVTNVREQGAPETGLATSLEVITPDGVRHPLWSAEVTDVDSRLGGDFDLADWRPDLHTALLRTTATRGRDRVVAYDVTTGETHRAVLPRRAISVGLDPDGTGILMTLYGEDPLSRTVARTWAGERTRLPGTGGYPMTSADGRTLVSPAGDGDGWGIVDLATRTSRTIAVLGTCGPIRWLDADTVLASCYTPAGGQLRAVHLDGGSTALGLRQRRGGDGDTVRAGGRRWYLSDSGGDLTVGGRGGITRVPHTAGLDHLARTPDGMLLLVRGDNTLYEPSRTGVVEVLDPATGAREVLTRLAPGQAWRSVIGAAEVRHWNP